MPHELDITVVFFPKYLFVVLLSSPVSLKENIRCSPEVQEPQQHVVITCLYVRVLILGRANAYFHPLE